MKTENNVKNVNNIDSDKDGEKFIYVNSSLSGNTYTASEVYKQQ
jgi:hypothetical protein